MRRIEWTDEAVDNLETIAAYIEDFNPVAARRLAERLVDAAQSLAEFPERGRRAGGELREWPIVYPYIIRYRVTGDTVLILRIRHGARSE